MEMSCAFRRVCIHLQLSASISAKYGPLRQAFRPAGVDIGSRIPALAIGARQASTARPANGSRQGRAIGNSANRREEINNAKAKKTNRDDMHKEEQKEKDERAAFALRKQEERPWHRVGNEVEQQVSSRDPTNGDKTRGRLLTTPTRLLKLILPLPFYAEQTRTTQLPAKESKDGEEEGIAPLALLVHPQQPLSYLERLLQAEIPPIDDGRRERIPRIYFRAEAEHKDEGKQDEGATKKSEGNVASYSGLGHEGPKKERADTNWVRWSSSTEVGDFIRDAARGREFSIGIEGYNQELRVAVPSFNDRTYYMRIRLRKMSHKIEHMAKLKEECDSLAHRGAHRIAQGGFGVLMGWWGVVYYVTFHTDFGWDLVEPVTYLVGLTTIMGGYLWFLYISRELSYKAALNVTVSKRQQALYQARGFDPQIWEQLVQEANSLRREIKMVATEYDVDWDETRDLGGEEVQEVLDKELKDARRKNGEEDEQEDDRAKQERKDQKKQEQKAPEEGDGSKKA